MSILSPSEVSSKSYSSTGLIQESKTPPTAFSYAPSSKNLMTPLQRWVMRISRRKKATNVNKKAALIENILSDDFFWRKAGSVIGE